MKIVSVDGDEGSKAAALERLAREGYCVILSDDDKLRRRYQEDPVEYALPWALRVLVDYWKTRTRITNNNNTVAVVDSHPGAARHVFAQLQFNQGEMSHAAFELYKKYYDKLAWTPDLVLYLDSWPSPREEHPARFQYNHYLKYAECPVVRVPGVSDELGRVLADALERLHPAAAGADGAPG